MAHRQLVFRAEARESRVLSVLVERGRARFFDVGPTATVELPCLMSPATRGGRFHSDRADAPGRGERAYQGRMREEQRRHVADVAARIVALEQDTSRELVLFGAPTLIRGIRDRLPPLLRACIIGTARLDPKRVTASIVQRESHRIQREWVELVPE